MMSSLPNSYLVLMFFSATVFAQTLRIQPSPTTENLRGISTPSHNVAWASGTHGTYLRTVDGGSTWLAAQVPGADALDFRDVEAFNADVAYLLAAGPGDQSRIYKTTDRGKNWSLQFTNHEPKGFFDCMAFWDRNRGIALGDPVEGKFELITTTDGGAHWKAASPAGLPPAIDGEGAFAASGTCIAVQGKKNVWFATGGKVARVIRSSDAGKTWEVAETPIVHGPDSAGIFSIAFRDAKHGVIAGGNYKQPDKDGPNLAVTDDGGRTWKEAAVSPQSYFSAVAYRAQQILVAGTAQAACLHDPARKSWRKTWALNLNALSVSPNGFAIAVGPKGAIVLFPPLD